MSVGKPPGNNEIAANPRPTGGDYSPTRIQELAEWLKQQPPEVGRAITTQATNEHWDTQRIAGAIDQTWRKSAAEAASQPVTIDQPVAPHPLAHLAAVQNIKGMHQFHVKHIEPSPEGHTPATSPQTQVAAIDKGTRTV